MPKFVNNCPICGDKIIVTRFYCPECQASVEGSFEVAEDPFGRLTAEQRTFLLTFVRSEGRLNRMEEILGFSYPTLKNRLNELILALGYEPEKESPKVISTSQRQQVLADLAEGRIDSAQALRYLKGEEPFDLI